MSTDNSGGDQHQELRADDLRGKQVVTQDGRQLGDIRSLLIGTPQWRVTALKVRLRRDLLEELELHRPLLGTQTVDIPTEQISGISDQVILLTRLDELSLGEGLRVEQDGEEEELGGDGHAQRAADDDDPARHDQDRARSG